MVGLWLASKVSKRVDTGLDRIGMVLFGRFVSPDDERQRRLEGAFLNATYRNYATKTVLFTAMAFISGTILGAYAIAAGLVFLEPIVRGLSGLPVADTLGLDPEFEFSLSVEARWILLVTVSALVFGTLGAAVSYTVRWWLPISTARVRQRSINEGLTRTTVFMYALSRGGMEFPEILRTLTNHQEVYGEAAREMSVAVREMDMFGRDMITALRRMSGRTPSERFKTFSENLASVLQSGGDLSNFLEEQFTRFREESEARQEDLLELLSTIAEGYVTVLVAGMLFFITILFIFGLTIADTLTFLQVIIYVIIPVANAGFALIVQQQLDQFGISGVGTGSGIDALQQRDLTAASVVPDSIVRKTRSDGGFTGARERDNRQMLWLYDRLYRVRNAVRNPVEVVFWNPTKILWVTVPVAVLIFLVRVPRAFAAEGISIRILDDLIIQSVLLVVFTYAVVRYLYKRHITAIEQALPEFLERIASLNEAGMSITKTIDRVRGTDVGVLTPEIDRIWRDLEYGSTVDDSFVRFGRRVRTTAVARVVTLLTNAMRASGNMGPVIRIAAEQHRAELGLRRQRRQQMFTYLVVIYIAFFVFLVIIVAISEMLVPNIPQDSAIESGDLRAVGAGSVFSDFGGVNQAAYTLTFFHAALIQAVCAGFVAGQLGEGSLRDGAKHAAIMLGLAYVMLVALTSPIASITPGEIPGEEAELVIDDNGVVQSFDEVSLSEGGFVAIYADERGGDGINGTLLGTTGYLSPGTHTDLRIRLDERQGNGTAWDRLRSEAENGDVIDLRLVPHLDTNGNKNFDFEQPYTKGGQVDKPYGTPEEGGEPGVSARGLIDDNFVQLPG